MHPTFSVESYRLILDALIFYQADLADEVATSVGNRSEIEDSKLQLELDNINRLIDLISSVLEVEGTKS